VRLLLDSQAFVYVASRPEALPAAARAAIEHADNDVFLSVASPLELQIKINLGKLTLARPLVEAVRNEIDRGTFELLPITLEHIDVLAGLPSHHRDPFDRILVAQAIHENLTIVTGDRLIAQYPATTRWE
jgi:PIN domain nuclease of toxin-antitoxin system